MPLSLIVERSAALPALAFAAEISAGASTVTAVCGAAVEVDDAGLIAGAWAGPFGARAIAEAPTSVGTALRLTAQGIVAVAGTASAAVIYVSRVGRRLVVSNSMALALARADDMIIPSYPFYTNDLATIVIGSDRYRHMVATERGRLSAFYAAVAIGEDLRCAPAPVALPPAFADFATYRSYLADQTAAMFANAADGARGVRYRPMASLSAGYDSPAAAVIARDAGCREGFTFGQPHDSPASDADSGAALGRALGLSIEEFRTHAYMERTDRPDVEFIASSFSGGQVYLASCGQALAGGLVISGYGGDIVWGRDFGLRRKPHFPLAIGGYSQNEFFLRAPALDFAIPVVAARRFAELGALSRSAEMRRWSVGGEYDRPIPRRILEDAGIPRGTFAIQKRRVTPEYDNYARRGIDMRRILSPATLAGFEEWLAKERPVDRFRALRHRLLVDSVGRLIWSGKLARGLAKRGIKWPPFPQRLLRLKVPIRRNAFVFNWAMTEQVRRYRTWLGAAGGRS